MSGKYTDSQIKKVEKLYQDGTFSSKEIALVTGIKLGAVKSIIERFRRPYALGGYEAPKPPNIKKEAYDLLSRMGRDISRTGNAFYLDGRQVLIEKIVDEARKYITGEYKCR
jgi:hypothetical protein